MLWPDLAIIKEFDNNSDDLKGPAEKSTVLKYK
jgi:hypothetical protein